MLGGHPVLSMHLGINDLHYLPLVQAELKGTAHPERSSEATHPSVRRLELWNGFRPSPTCPTQVQS